MTPTGTTYESTVNYTYDGGNRLRTAVDSISGTITRGYDDLDRLNSDATPQGTVSSTYDNAGRRASLTVPGQSVVNYSFNAANRLAQITQPTRQSCSAARWGVISTLHSMRRNILRILAPERTSMSSSRLLGQETLNLTGHTEFTAICHQRRIAPVESELYENRKIGAPVGRCRSS